MNILSAHVCTSSQGQEAKVPGLSNASQWEGAVAGILLVLEGLHLSSGPNMSADYPFSGPQSSFRQLNPLADSPQSNCPRSLQHPGNKLKLRREGPGKKLDKLKCYKKTFIW